MKKIWFLFFVFSLCLVPTQAIENQNEYDHSILVDIPAYDSWSFEITEDELSLITIKTNVLNPSLEYSVIVHNASFFILISRFNVIGDISFDFIWEGFYEVIIFNPNGLELNINVDLNSELLQERDEGGYYFLSQKNWSKQQKVLNTSLTVISVKTLDRGNYTLSLSILENNGFVKFYSSKKDPTKNINWKETAYSFSWTDSSIRFFILEHGYDWFAFEPLDNNIHDVVISLEFNSRLSLKLRDAVMGIVLIVSIIALISLRMKNKRRKRPRTDYYGPRQTQEEVQRKLHLVSQVDIRHEGGRYVYIPPDILDSRLLKKDKNLDEEEEK